MNNIKKYRDFESQDEIDKILDKISKYGIKSLTWHEKETLQKPDENYHTPTGDDDTQYAFVYLLKKGLIEADKVNLSEHMIEVYGLKNKSFPYFVDNFLTIEYETDDDGHNLYIKSEDYADISLSEEERLMEIKEKTEVFNYIKSVWRDVVGDDFYIAILDDDYDDCL